jgi:DNA-binding NarL/FixJ family response regulator
LGTRLFLIDDHPIVRESLQTLIAQRFEGTPVLDFASIEAFSSWRENNPLATDTPEVALLDVGLPGYVGIEAVLQFIDRWPQIRVIVFSGQNSPAIIRAVAQAGAKGFLSKNLDMKLFVKAIDLILAGGEFFPADVLRQAPLPTQQTLHQQHAVGSPVFTAANEFLSDRQHKVLGQLAAGASNKVIARDMNMSESTVKNTLAAIMRLLGTNNRTQTVQSARDRGLI